MSVALRTERSGQNTGVLNNHSTWGEAVGLQGKALKQGSPPIGYCCHSLHSCATGPQCAWTVVWAPSITKEHHPCSYLEFYPRALRMAFCVGIFILYSWRKRSRGDVGTKISRESKSGLSSMLLLPTSLPCRSQCLQHTQGESGDWQDLRTDKASEVLSLLLTISSVWLGFPEQKASSP